MSDSPGGTPPVDGIATLQRFLTRQPILDNAYRVVGYEPAAKFLDSLSKALP